MGGGRKGEKLRMKAEKKDYHYEEMVGLKGKKAVVREGGSIRRVWSKKSRMLAGGDELNIQSWILAVSTL